jgi:transposase
MVEPVLVTGGSTMPRSLTIRKPLSVEISQLHKLLEDTLLAWQRRRAEAILLYASGLNAVEIAQMLGVHTNTIYADLCAFKQDSLVSVQQPRSVGAPTRISKAEVREIWRLAEIPPFELGLPYGRWSLTKFRDHILENRLLKAISREHLRRLLKKGALTFVEFSTSSSAKTHADGRFYAIYVGFGSIYPVTVCCCSSMLNQ